MNINITQEQYVALKSLVLKYEALNETTNKPTKTTSGTKQTLKNHDKFKQILMEMSIFSLSELSDPKHKDTLEMYKRYYKALGEASFKETLKRVKGRADKGEVKNIKAYALTSLKQEQATKK